MRLQMHLHLICALAGTIAISGCASDWNSLFDNSGNASATTDNAASDASQNDTSVLGALQTAFSADNTATIRGSVTASRDYQLFDLGAGAAGDRWDVTYPGFMASGPFTVALFDADQQLLQRTVVSPTTPLTLVLRRSTSNVQVAVSPGYATYGGNFNLRVHTQPDVGVPAPRPQLVYLNFGAGQDVSVHGRPGIDFAAFDAGWLGSDYADQTAAMRESIVATMRSDYAPYNVTIVSSVDGPPPAEPHATIQFGGKDSELLGLADQVDSYNATASETAVVYVAGFADFNTMRLSTEEMGLMIGNVGSHELGHLLGLYHTREPVDVMDTTGTAWDLASAQDFEVAPLEASVFPVGFENSPRLLEDAVGRVPAEAAQKAPAVAKSRATNAMRAIAREAMRGRCGTCVHLNDPPEDLLGK